MNLKNLLYIPSGFIDPMAAVIKNPANYEGFALGSPITVDRKHYERGGTSIVTGVVQYPQHDGRKLVEVTNFRVSDLERMPIPAIDSSAVYKEVSRFNPDKIGGIKACLKASSCLVLKVEDLEGFVLGCLTPLVSKFKYNRFGGYNADNLEVPLDGPDDFIENYLYFINLEYAVPIFNRRKVDGFALSLRQIIHKASQNDMPIARFSAHFIFSEYEDNIFVLDGAQVKTKRPISNDLMNEIRTRVLSKPRIINAMPLPEMKKEVIEEKQKSIKVPRPAKQKMQKSVPESAQQKSKFEFQSSNTSYVKVVSAMEMSGIELPSSHEEHIIWDTSNTASLFEDEFSDTEKKIKSDIPF